jgi:hypothetical protein
LDETLKKVAGLAPKLDKAQIAPRTELLGLAALISQHAEDKKRLGEALEPLQAMLKKSYKQPALTQDDFFALCQSFANSGQFGALLECAQQAGQKFPASGGPTYFEVYALCKGSPKRLSLKHETRLDMALACARSGEEHRVAALIDNFLREFDELADEGMDLDDDFPFDFSGLDANQQIKLMNRLTQLELLSREELQRLITKTMPGFLLKNVSHDELLEFAKIVVMLETGVINLEDLMNSRASFGPFR